MTFTCGHSGKIDDLYPDGRCKACGASTEAADRARIQAIADAAKCAPEDVNGHLFASYGIPWGDVAPSDISTPEAQAAKAAHDEALVAELPPEKALQIARAVRAAPEKARELLTAAVSAAVDEALAKAAEESPK